MTEIKTLPAKQKATKELLARLEPAFRAVIPPGTITPEQFKVIVMQEFANTPALYECTPLSIGNSLICAAELGFVPSKTLGLCYLVPYKTECVLIIGYKGKIALARECHGIKKGIVIELVYANDEFSRMPGHEPPFRHVPIIRNRGEIIGGYGAAQFVDGSWQFVWMDIEEIDKIGERPIRQAKSRGKVSTWETDTDEMRKKTVSNRLCKLLPQTPRMRLAADLDAEEHGYIDKAHGSVDASDYIDISADITETDTETPTEHSEPDGNASTPYGHLESFVSEYSVHRDDFDAAVEKVLKGKPLDPDKLTKKQAFAICRELAAGMNAEQGELL